jgi:glycosyltransferase involved in cell wall biosynthesis
MSMKIGIDVRVLERKMTGVGRYLLNILKNLPECDNQNDYFLFSYGKLPQYEKERIKSIPTLKFTPQGIFQKAISPFWLNFVLPKYLEKYKIDLFFSPNHFLPLKKIKPKSIVVIHDVFHKIDKNFHPLYYRKYADLLLKRAVKYTELIVTISESSKRDIIRFYNVPEEKIKVIYEAAEEIFQPRNLSEFEKIKLREKYNLPEKFILYIGVLEKRKNIDGIIKIADLIKDKTETPIFLFGRIGYEGNQYIKEIKKRRNIQYKGFVENQDLPYIYNLATIFLFPSFYEGFGLPVLEAMQSGVPVLTSNTSSLPEIVGEAGLMHEPRDFENFAKDIIKLLEDRNFYDKMKNKGLEQAKKFSWKKTTIEVVDLFNRIIYNV